MRVISLLPSATEMVCLLGLREQLVGVTHECDFPASVQQLPKVTRTLIPTDASSQQIDQLVREQLQTQQALYTLDFSQVQQLQPDLIVTQALCDVCAVAEDEVQQAANALSPVPQVLNLEPTCLQHLFDCLQQVATAAGVADEGRAAIGGLQARVERIQQLTDRAVTRPKVVLLEWIDPLFCSGHWNPELVRLAGGEEVIGVEGSRSRTIEWPELQQADPDVMLIACCGFNISRARSDLTILRAHAGWSDLRCVQNQRVFVTDGSAYFNRPGPRLIESLELLAHLLHPELCELPPVLSDAVVRV